MPRPDGNRVLTFRYFLKYKITLSVGPGFDAAQLIEMVGGGDDGDCARVRLDPGLHPRSAMQP